MRSLALLASFLLATAIAAGFFGPFHPALDSFAHFRAHLLFLAVIGGLALVALRLRREGWSMVALGLLAATSVAPTWIRSGDAQASANALTVVHANLRFDNEQAEAAIAALERASPDVLLLAEVSNRWKANIAGAFAPWPYRHICDGRGVIGGAAILSRHPFSPTRQPACLDDGALAVAAIDVDGRSITVAEIHLHWPWPSRQMVEIEEIAGPLSTLGDDAVLAGDFNAAPWSAAVAAVARSGRLDIARGIGGTWTPPAFEAIRPFGLPIDNLLTGARIKTRRIDTLRLPGSDHLAVRATLDLGS